MTDVHPFNARSPAVQQAANWLRDQTPRPSPVVPALRVRFGLTAKEACEAIQSVLHEGERQ